MITVKVAKLPGAVKEVVLDDGATVNDALTAADISVDSNESLKVNGTERDASADVANGEVIVIAKGAKGNA
ncbi:MAG: hypothetical protein ACRBBW_16265 [Cellvibrionaceae bacterium]